MSQNAKVFLSYLLISLVPVLHAYIPALDVSGIILHALTQYVPVVLLLGFGICGFLGWRLNQTRILLTCLVFLAAGLAMIYPELFRSWNLTRPVINQVLAIALPLTLILIFCSREARALDLQSLNRLLWPLAPLIVLTVWASQNPQGFQAMVTWEWIPLVKQSGIPQLAWVTFIGFGLVVLWFKDKKVEPFVNASWVTLIPFLSAAREGIAYTGAGSAGPTLHTVLAFCPICVIQLHALFRMYWQRVYIDELTEIANRRALDEFLQTLAGEYAIAMIDIDHFKSFNDTYGHDEGDNVLRMVARSLEDVLGNKVYRYGGEEFCAVFPGFNAEDAYMYVNKARRKLESRKFYIRKPNSKRKPTSQKQRGKSGRRGKKAPITVSAGLASPEKVSQTPQQVIKLADQALYEAKEQGRNCVVMWNKELSSVSA